MAVAADLSIIEAAVMHAAMDPEGWQAVTEAVADAFPGTRPNFLDYDLARGPGAVAYQAHYEDAYLRSYHAHYRTVVPGFPIWAGLPVGHVAPLGEIVSERDLLRSEFWNDWLRPQGDLRQSALTVLHREGGRRILLGVPVERRAAGRVMAPLARAMRGLHPLMRHALGVNRMLLGLRLDAALLAREVEPAQAAVLLLSAQGILLHASRRAEAMLAEGALIRHDLLGRTSLADPAGQARLEAALRPAPPVDGLAFRVGSAERAQQVRLMPVPPEAMARLGVPFLAGPSGPGLLMVLRPGRLVEDRLAGIAGRLGLTQAEAAVALALAEGATLAEIASARGASLHTVRNQVKSALSKAGARRQIDLVRLIQGRHRPF